MTDTELTIAAGLETCFTRQGFTGPGVDALREAAGVSLRTLYKYFPSREAMVAGALEHRHRTYLAFLDANAPDGPGEAPVTDIFERLGRWMDERASRGCLFVSALAAHPDSDLVRTTVLRHKDETRNLLAARVARALPSADPARVAEIARRLLVVHEGQTALAASAGAAAATAAALALARQTIELETTT